MNKTLSELLVEQKLIEKSINTNFALQIVRAMIYNEFGSKVVEINHPRKWQNEILIHLYLLDPNKDEYSGHPSFMLDYSSSVLDSNDPVLIVEKTQEKFVWIKESYASRYNNGEPRMETKAIKKKKKK